MSHERPLSPHLQIYKPQLTSVLSILHRATGIALGIGIFPLAYWFWALAEGPVAFANFNALLSHWFGMFCLLGWSFCFFYHLGNGIRHLAWDAGYGFEIEQTYASGWLVVGFSVGATLLSWVIAFSGVTL